MIGDKKVVCVIPARLASSRFPKKILTSLAGKPLLQWAWEGALQVPLFDEVVLAIDAEETADVVKSFRGRYVMTSIECLNGTARLVELKKRGVMQADIWVNWQADEPFLSPKIFQDLLQSCNHSEADLWTLKKLVEEESRVQSPDLCKVVCDQRGYALYFSRSQIPYYRDPSEVKKWFKHVGLYAYSDAAMEKISCMGPCDLEMAESLEQLRFLFQGLKIEVHETFEEVLGIDRPEHLAMAEEYAKKGALFY